MRRILELTTVLLVLTLPLAAWAEEEDNSALAKKTQNPISDLISLPFTSVPIITANWNADTGSDVWTVPVGGGFGKIMRLGKLPINVQTQFFWNVHHPDIGPRWTWRFQVQLLFPKPK